MTGSSLIAKGVQMITLALLLTLTNPPISHSAGREVVAATNTVKSGSGVPSTEVGLVSLMLRGQVNLDLNMMLIQKAKQSLTNRLRGTITAKPMSKT